MKANLLFIFAIAAGCTSPSNDQGVGQDMAPGVGGGGADGGSGGDAGSGGRDAASGGGGDMAKSSSGGGLAALTHVWTIVLENHDYKEIVSASPGDPGATNAPYINGLIQQFGLATNYMDSGSHPSLPNYLYMVSGSTQNAPLLYDPDPTPSFLSSFPVTADNLGSQLQAAGINWRSYQDSATMPCQLAGAGTYAPKHDPFLYFTNIQMGANNLCANTNVAYAPAFATDLAAGTYRYTWITPDLMNDGHDPSANATDYATGLKDSDTWCSTEIPKIMASAAYQNGGVIFLTWDEAENRSGAGSADQVPMIVISPNLVSAGYKSSTAFTHASYLATVEEIFQLTPKLGAAATASTLAEFFK